ncbi:biopolymer transporter ExbD [Mameliella alba]|uniref:biopolymer transporter ExbD n=1 Tax=Mameliella alba TaxID=561184 RepID=UPI0021BD39CA|nr:biopolymer transporter ExbD [Mameliella alba]
MRRRHRRRKLSMTSLIDVILLLLLFFMLSSTFSRFAEVELAAGGAGTGAASNLRPVFLRLSPDGLSLNGTPHEFTALPKALRQHQTDTETDLPVIVALQGEVTAQRLTDLLVAIRALPGLKLTVLEAS